MLVHLRTASATMRSLECPGSLTLPWFERENAFSNRGVGIHGFLQAVPTLGRDGALSAIEDPDLRAACEVLPLDGLPLDAARWAAEVAFAYDVTTGKAVELGRGLSRAEAYAKLDPRTHLAGMTDVVGLTEDAVHIYDYKNGRHRRAYKVQLRILALLAARAYGVPRAHVGCIYLREDGDHVWMEEELDELDLLEVETLAVRLLREPEPRFRQGEWCEFCPAFESCPATTTLVHALATGPVSVADEIRASLTPATAARALSRFRDVSAVMKHLERALYAYAKERPIPLEDGKVFGEVETETEKVVGEEAYKVLVATHGHELAMRAVKLDSSKTAITTALAVKAKAEKVTIKSLVDPVLDQLRETGGIKVKRSTTVKEHRPAEVVPQGEGAR